MKRTERFTLVLAAGLLCSCQPGYGSVDIRALSSPPVPVRVRAHEIEIPVGIAVAVKAKPQSDNNNPYDTGDSLALASNDPDILTVDPTGDLYEFVLVGVRQGDTCVRVIINGTEEDCIDTSVPPQAGP